MSEINLAAANLDECSKPETFVNSISEKLSVLEHTDLPCLREWYTWYTGDIPAALKPQPANQPPPANQQAPAANSAQAVEEPDSPDSFDTVMEDASVGSVEDNGPQRPKMFAAVDEVRRVINVTRNDLEVERRDKERVKQAKIDAKAAREAAQVGVDPLVQSLVSDMQKLKHFVQKTKTPPNISSKPKPKPNQSKAKPQRHLGGVKGKATGQKGTGKGKQKKQGGPNNRRTPASKSSKRDSKHGTAPPKNRDKNKDRDKSGNANKRKRTF